MCTDRKENDNYSDTLAKFENTIDSEVQHLEVDYQEYSQDTTYNGDDE